MCVSIKPPTIPMPEPIPANTFGKATTTQKAPASAGRKVNVANASSRSRVGRGTLRIPLASSGLTASGLNLPSA